MQKTILVTGSSRGIGRAVAELAHQQGYRVVVHGRTESEALQAVHEALAGSYKLAFDVVDQAAAHKAIQELLKEVGHIDVLVNNAGIARNHIRDITEVDDEKAVEEFRTNILGTIHATQAVLPGMLKIGGGSVINVASIKGQYNLATMSTLTFATTKAGIISLTKALAKSYGSQGVRFNSISPGYVETDQVTDWTSETFQRINGGTIAGRMATPAEIARVVMFLASDEASYAQGSDFLIDGGYAIKGK